MTDNDFLQYFTLLLRATATLDVSRGVQSSHARSHKVHSVDIIDESYDDPIQDTDTYEVHAATRNPKATLPLPTWKAIQMEAFKIRVNDTSPTLGGLGTIATPEGYVIPLTFHHGLAYLADARPYTDHEWTSLPHVFLTQETEWNPTKFDYVVPPDWYTKRHDPPVNAGLPYDDIGVFRLQHLSVHYAHFPTKPSFSLRTRIHNLGLQQVKHQNY